MARTRSRAVLAAVVVAVVVAVLAVVAVRLLDDEPTAATPQDSAASDAPASAGDQLVRHPMPPRPTPTRMPTTPASRPTPSSLPTRGRAPSPRPSCSRRWTPPGSARRSWCRRRTCGSSRHGCRASSPPPPRSTRRSRSRSSTPTSSPASGSAARCGATTSRSAVRTSPEGRYSVHCGSGCLVEDSWLHEQFNPDGEAAHNNAFLSNGGSHMVIRHNMLHCTPKLNDTDGGCTADLSLFGDFGPIRDVRGRGQPVQGQRLVGVLLRLRGDAPGKPIPRPRAWSSRATCSSAAPTRCAASTDRSRPSTRRPPGNEWRDNTWDDGTELVPE